MPYSDETLLQLLSQDDQEAYTEIYNRYWKKLYVIAFNRLKEKESAEDVVHDVFASLWTGHSRKNIGSLENYLAVAVKYTILNKIRKQVKQQAYQNQVYATQVVDMPIEASLHYRQVLEMVHAEIERLPEKCRLIFNYSRNNNMPVKEIADRLQISPKTVESQLSKALRRLKLVTGSLHSYFLFFF